MTNKEILRTCLSNLADVPHKCIKIEDLPHYLKMLAKDRRENYASSNSRDTNPGISSAFSWSKTKEGHQFWAKVADEYNCDFRSSIHFNRIKADFIVVDSNGKLNVEYIDEDIGTLLWGLKYLKDKYN